MTERQPGRDQLGRNDDRAAPSAQAVAEAKRLEARRRFLLGGTATVSMLVTVSRARAFTYSDCAQNAEARGFDGATELLTRLGVDGSDPAGLFCQIFFPN